MELRQLVYAVAVARHGSFTRAARALSIAQPSLSAQIRKLEHELGAPLFERTTRRVTVTPVGEHFIRSARRILALLEATANDVATRSGMVAGTLRIAAWFSVHPQLPAWLGEFLHDHPLVNVEVREENSDMMLVRLRSGDLDVAFPTITEDLDFHGLEHSVLVEEPFVVMVSPTSSLAGARVSIEALADEPLVTQLPHSALRKIPESAFRAHGRTARVVAETSQTSAIPSLVAAGIGSAVVPLSVASRADAHVRVVRLQEPLTRVAALAWRRGVASPATQAFVAFVRSRAEARG